MFESLYQKHERAGSEAKKFFIDHWLRNEQSTFFAAFLVFRHIFLLLRLCLDIMHLK